MIATTGGLFALVFLTGVTTLFLHRASDVEDSTASGPVASLLGFFGIGELPVLLAIGVFTLAAGASGLAYAALTRAALGDGSPAWWPATAACTATGLGLGVLRVATAANTSGQRKNDDQFEKGP